jgi:hypothetical protein
VTGLTRRPRLGASPKTSELPRRPADTTSEVTHSVACDTKRARVTIPNELIIDYVAACEMLSQRLDLRDFADGWSAGSKIEVRVARGHPLYSACS